MESFESPSPPSARPLLSARIRRVLSLFIILGIVALAVVLIVGGATGIADLLHVSEVAVAPIGIGALLAAWLAWRAVNLTGRHH